MESIYISNKQDADIIKDFLNKEGEDKLIQLILVYYHIKEDPDKTFNINLKSFDK